ncbi:T9SS type A sorting domain-containing protein [Flavobacterium sp. 7A]|uniref:T9SS type A sorting domain-containing protein n=1 Tax=Flavobacterium sp. 7A TaxID=2940571 RepID=UPI0022276DE1|nr:T9SS type A sorting domain-containing protein [Flavobacterium sp. 7A]MCW2118937.1 hypothetical protein [Flavobacterium sp. 7A]
MNKIVLQFFLLFSLLSIRAQTATSITKLESPTLDESSGLLFYNNKIITHNDSGGAAKLYELSASTGAVTRTITVNNATNGDWEDLSQDQNYIYIGDIGNNFGNRKDLKIYKISKDDYNDSDDNVTPEIIYYSYNDQTDFTSKLNNNNWDAEALISYGDKLLIFSKNWADKKVNVYSIPKTSGTYTAVFESNYNTNGLITGAEISPNEDVIYLTGYSEMAAPFLYTIHNIPNKSCNVFSGTTSAKITNIVPLGNQIEGVALLEITPTKHRLYLSNEKYVATFGSFTVTFPAKLWLLEINTETLSLQSQDFSIENIVNLYPNPFDRTLTLNKVVDEVSIFDALGKLITKQQSVNNLSLENLDNGIYFAHIKTNNTIVIRKIIKK